MIYCIQRPTGRAFHTWPHVLSVCITHPTFHCMCIPERGLTMRRADGVPADGTPSTPREGAGASGFPLGRRWWRPPYLHSGRRCPGACRHSTPGRPALPWKCAFWRLRAAAPSTCPWDPRTTGPRPGTHVTHCIRRSRGYALQRGHTMRCSCDGPAHKIIRRRFASHECLKTEASFISQ